jgi:alkylation response protein AidB-like acyl-CoA dehydrogenase
MIVDLHPTDDQQMIDDSVRGLLADRLPVDRLRDAEAWTGRAERAIWQDLAELGLFGLGLPDDKGGIGYGLPEEVVVARALGEYLVSPTVLAQIAAVHLAEDESLRSALSTGAKRACFVNAIDPDHVHLIDGEGADLAVILADGVDLRPIDILGAAEPVDGMDEAIALARLGTPSALPASSPEGQRLSLLLAAYQVGLSAATRDMAVAYAGTREQFGQPIGAFQAIKHMCADMAVRTAAADAQTCYAAVTFGLGAQSHRDVASARLLASDAALANAKANIQIHGGMGFTAECDAHLFLKRAHLFASLGSSRRIEQRRIMA